MQGVNEILKTQMILSAGASRNPLTNILALNLFDLATKTFPVWSTWGKAWCCSRRRRGGTLPSPLKVPRATIAFERAATTQQGQPNRPSNDTVYQCRMDAVVHYATTLPAMKSLLSVSYHDYLPNEFEPIQLDSDTFFELQELRIQDGKPEIIKFRLSCYEHDVQYLQTFVDTCTTDYERRQANKLGSHRYFFDQVVQTKVKGSLQNTLPMSHLLYTKTKFTTNRNFDNVFFEDRKHVQGRTQFFLEHRDWYDKKGIPYTLGFMFHGPPGTGKTSTVKAIAKEGRRHIINVQLSEIKTKAQLQHLFFNDEIHVYNGTNTEKYTIPVSERLYVIEDIDAMGDTVLRREWKKPTPVSQKPKTDEDAWLDRQKETEQEQLDLSFLLNLLDGTLEANGRVLIITTNFPERLDRALVRPGRIDMIVNFKKCNLAVLREMLASFYETDIPIDGEGLEYKWSPAEVNQILFRNFKDPDTAVRELLTLTPQDLYGFPENGSAESTSE